MPNDLPPIAPETLELIARLKVEYGVSTNTEVLREALRRARPAKETALPANPIHAAAVEAIEARYQEALAKHRDNSSDRVLGFLSGILAAKAAISFLPRLAAPAGDVAALVARLRAGEPCHPPCKVMDARSGCICGEAADGLSAIAAERDAARGALKIMREACTKAEAERDALAERLRKVEEALRPFAESGYAGCGDEFDGHTVVLGVTFGDFRRARALTQASAPETGEPKP